MILRYWYDKNSPYHVAVVNHVRQLPAEAPLWISIVTLGEIEYGFHSSEQRTEQDHKDYLRFINEEVPYSANVDWHTIESYGKLRALLFAKWGPKKRKQGWVDQLIEPASGKVIGLQENDIWIAAHALQYNLVLVTNDRRLSQISEIELSSPHSLSHRQ